MWNPLENGLKKSGFTFLSLSHSKTEDKTEWQRNHQELATRNDSETLMLIPGLIYELAVGPPKER